MRPAGDERFPKRIRLRKRSEFLAVQRGGRRVATPHFIVYGRSNGGGDARIGVTVSKKVGRAHVRNRIKRVVREAFRRNASRLPGGLDLVLIAKSNRALVAYEQAVDELVFAAGRLHARPPARRSHRRRRR